MKTIKEIYAYREMIVSLVRRELRGKYKASFLGFLWTFVNPLLQLLVYTIVFSIIMRNGIKDYYLFLFVALIPWLFFSTCASTGCGCVVTSSDMVKKIYFPREVLPIAFVTSQFVNMLLCFVVLFGVLIVSGKGLSGRALLYLPIVMVVEYILALGITLLFSGVSVYFRDLMHIMGILIIAWQFMTPVMYSLDMVPKKVLWVFRFNPMSSVITAYRDILYYKQPPKMQTLAEAVIIGCVLLIVGAFSFRRLQRHFAENM